MRRVVAGISANGASSALADGPPVTVFRFDHAEASKPQWERARVAPTSDTSPGRDREVVVAELWSTAGPPTRGGAPDPTVGVSTYDTATPPGSTKWRLVSMGPNHTSSTHRTDTLDYDTVISGEVELMLGTETVRLSAGDTAVVAGAVHTWRTGASGCVLSITMIGLATDL